MSKNDPMVLSETKLNRAKLWQIVLFTLNNSSTNIYMFAFGFVTYYSTGLVGLAALFVSQIMGYIRIFDGLIDPAIGVLIDKTDTKFGKYRPIMVLGNVITVLSFLILFNIHSLGDGMKIPIFLLSLVVHKIGYSLQATVTKAGQAALTSDPKQRPIFNIVDGWVTTLLFTGGQIVVANFLVPKYGGFTPEFFKVFIPGVMVISAILGILAVIGIAQKDNKQYFGIGEKTTKTSFKDYWEIIKGNKPLQMLTMAAAFVKFNSAMFGDQIVLMILFGIIFGNFGLSGTISLVLILPNLMFTTFAATIAQKRGLRYSYVRYLQGGVISLALLGGLLFFANPGDLSFSNPSLWTVAFVIVFACAKGFSSTPTGLALTMAADVSDYETSVSGRYVSGMLSTMFSLTDSVASSFAPMSIGWVLAAVGFAKVFPTADTPLSPQLRLAGIVLLAVLPLVGTLIALAFMKFYPLNKETMEGIQIKIAEMKQGNPSDGDAEMPQAIPNTIPAMND
ncbi:MFS transporter [Trichococcus pasteurii]|uniref:Mfs/sugar transport protein n=1 Tax=Trichococcus pasteurii TaxID=43064 RepID=A0A1W1IEA5_9LACT|nr:MFS transporter [Trichococcus pasteurii]SFE07950.1 Na+/melibiose symporter [Trichococcus pasteurii]SLM51241.1 mfs/sugar transport protein [Trichococcus pasteurii]SSB92122.1 mfs/sugar transport protein [Trichococcus pasteurii]